MYEEANKTTARAYTQLVAAWHIGRAVERAVMPIAQASLTRLMMPIFAATSPTLRSTIAALGLALGSDRAS
jgi:hypothetical protein